MLATTPPFRSVPALDRGLGVTLWVPRQDPTSVVFLDIDGVLRRLHMVVGGTGDEIRPLNQSCNTARIQGMHTQEKQQIRRPSCGRHSTPLRAAILLLRPLQRQLTAKILQQLSNMNP